MLIDAHAHIGFSHRRYPMYIRDLDQMLRVMDRFCIGRACVSSMKAIQYDFVEGNRELAETVGERFLDRFIPFCVVHPRYGAEALGELREYLGGKGWRGVKLHPVEQLYPADAASCCRVAEVAAEHKVPVAIHSSQDDFAHPARIGRLAGRFPEVTFIMVHMGKILCWMDAIEVAREHPNIILDTTDAMFADGLVEAAVEAVGASRVIWGSNLPVSYPGPNLKRITIARISDSDKNMILGANILRILGLQGPAVGRGTARAE